MNKHKIGRHNLARILGNIFTLKEFFVCLLYSIALSLVGYMACINTVLINNFNILSIIGIVSGYYFADFFTGFYHFFLDNFKFKNIPILEKQACEFQIHHKDPDALTKKRLGQLCYGPMWGVILYLLIVFSPLYAFYSNTYFRILISWFSISFSIFTGFSQLFHMWSHKVFINNNRLLYKIIYLLRKFKIILDPVQHSLHHTKSCQNYEIVSGVTTKLTNYIYKFIHNKILKR
jgi:hypothetical protein